jgi:RND family efflux transporter MFP subunit
MNMHNKMPAPVDAGIYSFPAAATVEAGKTKRGWLLPLVIVLIVAALAYGGYRALRPAAAPPATVASVPDVTVMVPGTTSVSDVITAPGSIAARRDAAVGVQGEGGRVTAVLVDAGRSVAAGQVLARIDNAVQLQQVRQLEASVRSSQADAALADSNLERAQPLVAKGFISKADIDQRTAARDGARARVALAQAQLAESRERLARLDIRAPAGGLILARNVEVGQIVSPSSPALFRLAEGGVLEMRAQVAEQDMERLKVGMSASVTPVGSTTAYPGKLWLLDPVIDVVSRQGIARIALAYAPGLRVGAFARTIIEAGETAAPVLPQSAVLVDEQGSYVMIVGEGNRTARRGVTVGTVGDEGVSIAKGLNGTERVVVSAGAFIRAGEKVDPVGKRAGS